MHVTNTYKPYYLQRDPWKVLKGDGKYTKKYYLVDCVKMYGAIGGSVDVKNVVTN